MGASVDHAVKQIRQARDDKEVKAVVLRVDSEGGTVSGSDLIWREVEIFKTKSKKPLVVSMGGLAASGGYYISAPADAIFAEPSTWTGSIGVIMQFPQIEGLLEKFDVKYEIIATGKWKGSGSPFRTMTPDERQRWVQVVDQAYDRFVRIVAMGRKLPKANVVALANGKVYTADEAKDLKLVDEIGYLEDAIAKAKSLASMTKYRVIKYSHPVDLTSLLLGATAPKRSAVVEAEELLQKIHKPEMLYILR